MALSLNNLDKRTRELMLKEVELDIKNEELYISDRLNESGKKDYPKMLIDSIKEGDDSTLASNLHNGYFNPTYLRKNPKGGYSNVKMPVNAPEVLAEGEFNRFYIRALCQRVIEDNKGQLRVYRARYSQNPRPESEAKIGEIVNANRLLIDLRQNIGLETHLGIPSGPNSGLSVELI